MPLSAAAGASPEMEDLTEILQAGVWLREQFDLLGDAVTFLSAMSGLTAGQILAGSGEDMVGRLVVTAARRDAAYSG